MRNSTALIPLPEESSKPTVCPKPLPCFTTAAFEAARDAGTLPHFIPRERLWLTALLDSIAAPVLPDSPEIALWGSPWGQDPWEHDGNIPASAEHVAYVACIKAIAAQSMPWLDHMLNAARALVSVAPGSFSFLVGCHGKLFFNIEELVPYTHLLPWVTEEEQEMPN
jgi:hypothetical protein